MEKNRARIALVGEHLQILHEISLSGFLDADWDSPMKKNELSLLVKQTNRHMKITGASLLPPVDVIFL